jgi:hypothetical protein
MSNTECAPSAEQAKTLIASAAREGFTTSSSGSRPASRLNCSGSSLHRNTGSRRLRIGLVWAGRWACQSRQSRYFCVSVSL